MIKIIRKHKPIATEASVKFIHRATYSVPRKILPDIKLKALHKQKLITPHKKLFKVVVISLSLSLLKRYFCSNKLANLLFNYFLGQIGRSQTYPL